MPRKSKAFKSKQREAQKACRKGDTKKANEIWQQIIVDRVKLRAEKAEKRAARKGRAVA
ncbi:MAG: hypothetical protein ACUVXJ_06465 [Phycisphaerae bacterium]